MANNPSPKPKTYAEAAELAIGWAFDHLNLPYKLGGTDKNGIDCSGMTLGAWRFATAGEIDLTHYAAWQYYETSRIFHNHIGLLRRGDLVFYEWNQKKQGPDGQSGGPDHVNIYLGWYKGSRWCVQATTFGIPSEVIPLRGYVDPAGFGRVKYADWNHKTENKAEFKGAHVNEKKWAKWL